MDTELAIGGSSIGGDTVLVFTILAITAAMLLESLAPRRKLDGSLVWRWFNNFSLAAVAWWITTAGTALFVFYLARWTEINNIGLFQAFPVPIWVSAVVLTVVSQGISYGLHVAFHKVSWLWPMHAIHHMDTDIDVSTSFRNHPLETLVTLPLVAPLILMLGTPPEAALFSQLFAIATAVFSHSNLYLPERVDRVLRLFVVTPDYHRLHHCSDRRFTDSNYANGLPWFDYLFGTASDKPFKEQESMELGLEYLREAEDSRVDRLLLLPFIWWKKGPKARGTTSVVEAPGQ